MSNQNSLLRLISTFLHKKSKRRMSERIRRGKKTKGLIQLVITRKILLLLKIFEPHNISLCLLVSVHLGREEPSLHPIVLSN
jgi:hypothetical protein